MTHAGRTKHTETLMPDIGRVLPVAAPSSKGSTQDRPPVRVEGQNLPGLVRGALLRRTCMSSLLVSRRSRYLCARPPRAQRDRGFGGDPQEKERKEERRMYMCTGHARQPRSAQTHSFTRSHSHASTYSHLHTHTTALLFTRQSAPVGIGV